MNESVCCKVWSESPERVIWLLTCRKLLLLKWQLCLIEKWNENHTRWFSSVNDLLTAIFSFQPLNLFLQPCSFLYTWRSGEGNTRDYGSSVTGPSACHERVKLMAWSGVGGLRSHCCKPWKRMPFIADWPSHAIAGGLSPDVLNGELGGAFAWISS